MQSGNAAPSESDSDVLQRIPCLACQYDLRGLTPDSICPECTFPAHISRAEARRLPAPYLRALALCVWLTLAPPCTALCAFAVHLLNAAALPGVTYPIFTAFTHLLPLSLIVWATGVVALECVRSPSRAGTDPEAPSRARIAAFVLFALAFSSSVLVLRYAPHLGALIPLPHPRDVNPAWFLALAAAEALVVAQMLTSLDLARRLESKRLRDSARALLFCSVPSTVLFIALMQELLDPDRRWIDGLLIAVGVAGSLACLLAVFLVCIHTRVALNRLRTIRKNLIRDNRRTPTSIPITPQDEQLSPPVNSKPNHAGIRCLSCGYDLTGLHESGVCPECAAPIERSLRGNLLRFASPAYLKTLRTGATLALVASILYIFEFIPRIVISAIFLSLGIGVSNALEAAINISALAAMLFGWWMLSTPDPAFIGLDDSRDWRVRLRWILPIASLVIVCNEGSRFIFAGTLASSVSFGAGAAQISLTYSEMLVWVSRLAHATVIYCGLNYIRVLAFRVPSQPLRKSASDASATMGVIIGLLLLIIVFGIAGKFEGLFTGIAVLCALIAMIALLVWLIQYFGVLGRLRAELSRSITAAHAIARYESARDHVPLTSLVSADAPDATDSIHPPPITQSGSDAS